MPDDFENNDKNDDKIIRFPGIEQRREQDKQKRSVVKEEKKAEKDHALQEKIWRDQFRAQQAKKMAAHARMSSGAKPSFVNWDKIPPLTRILCGGLILIHILTFLLPDQSALLQLHYTFGFTPAVFSGGESFSPLHLISPVTSLFLHGGWLHLLINAVMLLVLGSFSETNLGARRFAIFFFASGLAGNLFYFALSPGSIAPVIGASGAVNGLFAINMLMMNDIRIPGRAQTENAGLKFLIVWIMISLITGLLFGNISWQSHLGGLLGGAALYTLWKKGKIRF